MNRLVFLWALALVAGPLAAEPTARVFGLNLFGLTVDLRWSPVTDPNSAAWEALGVFPKTATRAAEVPVASAGFLGFRRQGVEAWSTVKEAGQPRALVLEANGVYLALVRADGGADLVRVGTLDPERPQVLFVNAARGATATLRLGAVADGQAPGWKQFVSAPEGPATLTWSWPTMPPGTDLYRVASAQPGKPGVTDLRAGRLYLALVSGSSGAVFELTP